MAHLTLDQITDRALGLADEATRERIERHLATGCRRCNRMAEMIALVRRVTAFDAAHQPGAGALRTVKALGGFQRRRRRKRRVRMRLSFDSYLQPATAGLRNLAQESRHLVFYAQEYALDLRLDCERSARDLVVVGQLMNRDQGPIGGAAAYLLAGEEVVSHATTGGLGEFHMAGQRGCEPQPPKMRLRLVVDDEELIEVDLDPAPGRPSPPESTERPL